ncbi:MAG: hypothetical protein LQ338_005027 [Usnochroma carphineum]|nr:MAG: hypothetical protein LQ338_005027 [Usnochroma carphineum]
MRLYLLTLASWGGLILAVLVAVTHGGSESDQSEKDVALAMPQASKTDRTYQSLQPSNAHDIAVYHYRVPNTETSLKIEFYLKDPLLHQAVRELLFRSLTEVTSILEVAGDGLVPGQKYSKDWQWADGGWVHLAVWSDRDFRDQMTYGIVKETLVGLRYYTVTRRFAFESNTVVSHGDLGTVAFAFIVGSDEGTIQ